MSASSHVLCAQMCVIVRGPLCVSCQELRFTPINHCVNPRLPRSVKAAPGYGESLSCAQVSLSTVLPFRGSEGIALVHSSIVIFFFIFFSASLFLLPCVCSLPSQFFLPSQRPPGCSLSKPIVSMHITNKLCSSKGYETHFCSATHCRSIISCYHDMPL